MRALVRMTVTLMLTVGWVSSALAHAILVESSPGAGEVTEAPARVVLRFNGRIEKRLSSVTVTGGPQNTFIRVLAPEPSGRSNNGSLASAALTPDEGPSPNVIEVPLATLAPGSYRVEWRVLSVDGHLTKGVVRFVIVAPRPAPSRGDAPR